MSNIRVKRKRKLEGENSPPEIPIIPDPTKEESITEIFNTKPLHEEPKPFKRIKVSDSWGKNKK